jgi:uncharacterized membrane protein YfcA
MVLAAAATLAGATVQSATGFGFALILSPALFAVLDPYEAVTALLGLGLALNLLVLFGEGRPGPVRWRAIAPMLLAALPGLALGTALLALLPKPTLQIVVGIAVLVAAALQGRGDGSAAEADPGEGRATEPSLGSACAVGLASGALTTSTSVSGPPIVLWLQAHGVRPDELRASLAASFLVLNLVGGAAVLVAGGTGEAVGAAIIAPLLALTLVGHLLGARLFRRLDARRFRSIALGLVALAGAASVGAGLAAA